MKTSEILLAALLAAVSVTHAGTTRFYDGTFNNSDWEAIEFNSSGDPSDYQSSQQASGGNPGEFMLTSTNWQGTALVARYEQQRGAVYDPKTQGAIDSITYSEDNISLPNAQATGPAIRQDGIIYWADPVTVQHADWKTHTWAGLTEADFVVPSDSSKHPDFSSAGSTVEFGFFRANSGSGYSGGWISAGIDNWCVSVHSVLDAESNLLVNAGFETQVGIPDVRPDHAGYWAADPAIIVAAEQGVLPSEGQKMLMARRRVKLQAEQEREQRRVNVLMGNAQDWHSAKILRAYLDAVADIADEQFERLYPGWTRKEWLTWTHQQADRLDPFSPSPHSVLDESIPD